jgi:hypothetical protein
MTWGEGLALLIEVFIAVLLYIVKTLKELLDGRHPPQHLHHEAPGGNEQVPG